MDRPLPSDLEAERLLLGAALTDETALSAMRAAVESDDWSLEIHRRIWGAMVALFDSAVLVNRVSLYDELRRRGQADLIGGFTQLCELDANMPRLSSVDGYIAIVKDKALLRRMILQCSSVYKRCIAGDHKADELFESAGREWTDLAPSNASDFASLEKVIEKTPGGFDRLMGPRHSRGGIPLPWEGPQRIVANILPEELVILAGPTGYGKTCKALQIATHAARLRPDCAAVVVSLEMSKESVFARMVVQEAQVDGRKARAGFLGSRERQRLAEAAEGILSNPLVLDDPGPSTAVIRAKLRKLAMRRPISLVVIDYLQLVPRSGKADNRSQEVGSNARAFKLMSGEFKCPFLVLSQFNRAPETEKRFPSLRDLRESGEIEQHANSVWFIWPDHDRSASEDSPVKPVRWIYAKQRDGETGVSWPMNFHSHMQRFEEVGRHMEAVAS